MKSFDERFNELIVVSEPWLPEEHFVHSEPEDDLAAFLYNFLPNRVLYAGANVGDFTDVVSSAGYRVYSFEPFPAAFDRLKTRMTSRSKCEHVQLCPRFDGDNASALRRVGVRRRAAG